MNDAGVPRFYLDTTLFIGVFDGPEPQANHLREVFAVFRERPLQAVTSEFTLAEVLGKESPKSWAVQTRFFLDLIIWGKFLDLIPVSRDVLLETGNWRRVVRRAGQSITLPDASM